ncbi:hypothetical protein MFIFM68171_07357 [Madurella fahalii]|uniref:Peptidase C14 caspase domain-containing protein n=1 Tax=Madurella fahalii TaxID=1157608 RepID=A0ABQ0GHC1_9PEZI
MEQRPPQRFAVLIGIDCYFDKPLRGCVRDVHAIRQHLESRPMAFHIDLMVASKPADAEARCPPEDERQWPTWDNVVARLEAITMGAQSGDFVYIHYSGHGTSLGLVPGSTHPHKSTADLSLDLLAAAGDSVCYLRGFDLACLVSNMVSKGLHVTLILDCCFSGSVLRGGDNDDVAGPQPAGERFLPYDVEVDAASPRLFHPEASTNAGTASRDGSLLPNWLIDPAGYAIITACGPHEVAKEISVDRYGPVGALSHFLIRTLLRLGAVDARLGDIYQSVCSRFADMTWSPGIRQTPMLYGNKNISFLGVLRPSIDTAAIPLFRSPTAELMLRAGRAHGLFDGDLLNLYPIAMAAEVSADARGAAVRAKVASAGDLVSLLQRVDGSRVSNAVGVGWSARLVSQPSLQTMPISVASDLPGLRQVLLEGSLLGLVLKPGAEHPWPGSFSVGMNTTWTDYEIRADVDDDTRPVVSLPAHLPLVERNDPNDSGQGDTAKAHQLLGALLHLTRFRHIESIRNPRSSLSSLGHVFTVRIRGMGETSWQDIDSGSKSSRMDVRSGATLEIELRNDSSGPLYFHIYDLGPLWQVRNIFDGDHEVVLPKDETRAFTGREILELEMCVPDQLIAAGRTWCDDVIKILVTDEPTSFAALGMDTLLESLSSKSAVPCLRQLPIFDDGVARGTAGRWDAVNIRVRTHC